METLVYFKNYLTDNKLPIIVPKDFGKDNPLSGNYVPSTDTIQVSRTLDPRWQLYTIAHELVHASGHETRLNRFTMTNLDVPYNRSLEEITADTGAFIIASVVGGSDFLLESAYKTLVKDELAELKKLDVDLKTIISYEDIYNGVGFWIKTDYKKKFFEAKRFLLEISK